MHAELVCFEARCRARFPITEVFYTCPRCGGLLEVGYTGVLRPVGTLREVWRARRRYAATGRFKAYLYTFARHIWLEQCRRVRKERMLGLASDIDDYFDSLAAPASGEPDGMAVRAESRASIEAALDELPEEQRLAFTLRYMQGLTPEEIARVMDCPVNTVRSRKLAALRKLRELLQSRRNEEIRI